MPRETPYSLPDYRDVDFTDIPDGEDVMAAYENGYVGSAYSGEAEEQLQSAVQEDGGKWEMQDNASASGFSGQGTGKTILIHKEIEKMGWGAKIGYPNQQCGDCVSHGTAKAMGYTLVTGITQGGNAKPETNGIESKMWPIASESHYWYRAKSSDGWYASKSLEMSKKNTGIVIRADIKGACDLRTYSKSTAHCYGSKAPPADVKAQLDDNPVLTYSKCSSYEEIIDAISAGYGVQTDGGEGFSKQCDDNGVAKRSGSWSHSMSIHGFIDTPEFKAKYGCGGLLIQNSWGAFNKNSHSKVMGTNTGIPAGSFFALWSDVKKRSYYVVSNVTDWPNRKLPSWNLDELI